MWLLEFCLIGTSVEPAHSIVRLEDGSGRFLRYTRLHSVTYQNSSEGCKKKIVKPALLRNNEI
jgi:hypothetical protein